MHDFVDYIPYISTVVELGELRFSLRRKAPGNCTWIGIGREFEPGITDVMHGLSIPLPDEYASMVVSAQLENDIAFWNTFVEMVRVCKVGGHVYLTQRASPLWRFGQQAMEALAFWAAECDHPVEVVETWPPWNVVYRRV